MLHHPSGARPISISMNWNPVQFVENWEKSKKASWFYIVCESYLHELNCADDSQVIGEWPGIVDDIPSSQLLKSSWVKDWSWVDEQVIGTVNDLSTLLRLLTLTGLIGPFSLLRGTLFAVRVTEPAVLLRACTKALNSCLRLAATLKSCFTQSCQSNLLIIDTLVLHISLCSCNFFEIYIIMVHCKRILQYLYSDVETLTNWIWHLQMCNWDWPVYLHWAANKWGVSASIGTCSFGGFDVQHWRVWPQRPVPDDSVLDSAIPFCQWGTV